VGRAAIADPRLGSKSSKPGPFKKPSGESRFGGPIRPALGVEAPGRRAGGIADPSVGPKR
jgi:hypothetical protein